MGQTKDSRTASDRGRVTNPSLGGRASRSGRSDGRGAVGEAAASSESDSVKEGTPPESGGARHVKLLAAAGLAALFFWAYWPTLAELTRVWSNQPDYSHGYFVPLVSAFFLWVKRDRFPGLAAGVAWAGLALVALSLVMRYLSALWWFRPMDGWSMLVWLAGAVWVLGGAKVLRWSLPAIAFLLFMIPLPFKFERSLSTPLQTTATNLSTWSLQVLGQPALAEGNTILIGDVRLEVEEACSGLRIFMGIIALAFAYVILVPRPWWERMLLLVGVVPIALVANATRIVITGLLNLYVSGEAAQRFTHDVAGWVMIPFAAALFALLLWYLGALFREVEVVDVGAVVRKARR